MEKLSPDREIHLFMSYSGGFPLKSSSSYAPYMIVCFDERLALVELCKNGLFTEVIDENRQQFVCRHSAASSMTSKPRRHDSSPCNNVLILFGPNLRLDVTDLERIVT